MSCKKTAVVLAALLVVAVVLYTVYDNNRVAIIRQTIVLDRLPASFEGFTILQITDLHGKRFGDRQRVLLEAINGISYDVVVMTGDMMNSRLDLEPWFELLDGLTDSDHMIFTPGNHDYEDYDFFTGVPTDFGNALIDRGVALVNEPYPIQRNGDTIWFTSFQFHRRTDEMIRRAGHEPDNEQQLSYWRDIKRFWEQVGPQQVKIALTHYPLTERFLTTADSSAIPDYDLIIAGHYHGGQFRLPLYGALYIPEPTGGMFPRQHLVSGLNRFGRHQQYVSRGLGASDVVRLLSFRLFNTPEINVLTLTGTPNP